MKGRYPHCEFKCNIAIGKIMTRKLKFGSADDLIDNSGPAEALRIQVERLHRQYQAQAATGKF